MTSQDAWDLSKYAVPGTHEVFYVPNFVTEDEEEYLIRKIQDSPLQKWKQLAHRRLQLWGGEVSKNVLFPQDMPSFIKNYPDLIARLRKTGAFDSSPHRTPNHVILNEYLPGQGIMPHEDGPAYHPVVATISLGSHSLFHYYRYKAPADESPLSAASTAEGKLIDPSPVLSIFLEPRSVVITTSSLYTVHLHGIQGIDVDNIVPSKDGNGPPLVASLEAEIANWEMVTEPQYQEFLREGGSLKRGVRYSLTCRDVGKVVSKTSLGIRR